MAFYQHRCDSQDCCGGGNEAVCFLHKHRRSYFLRIPGMEKSPCQFALDIFTDREATFGLVFANIVFHYENVPKTEGEESGSEYLPAQTVWASV